MKAAQNVFKGALAEYIAGLHARGVVSSVVRHLLAPLVGVAVTAALLLGLCDVASGWRLPVQLWAHIVSTAVLAVAVIVSAVRHVRRTRIIGRLFLREAGKA